MIKYFQINSIKTLAAESHRIAYVYKNRNSNCKNTQKKQLFLPQTLSM